MIGTIETSSIWNGGEITDDMYSEIQGAMIQSAGQIATKAKTLVPVDEGDLRDSIRAVGKRKRTRGELLARSIVAGKLIKYEQALPGAWVFAGLRRLGVFWAHWVEFGTYFKPARPYLRPAVDANFNAVLAESERAGRRVINKRRRSRKASARRRAAT